MYNQKHQKHFHFNHIMLNLSCLFQHFQSWLPAILKYCSIAFSEQAIWPFHTDKKKIKFSSYIRKLRRDRLQIHLLITASSNIFEHYLIYLKVLPHTRICIWLCNRSHLNFLKFEENLIFFISVQYLYLVGLLYCMGLRGSTEPLSSCI